MKYRLYGRIINTWTTTDERGREILVQLEIEYKEYDEAGRLVGTGTEDFSAERYRTALENRYIYTWDGQRRNKGGYRWFECREHIRIRKQDRQAVKAYFKSFYNAELIELR